MARPQKKGLDYFPKDVDFYNDFKIIDLLNNYGPLGLAVYEIIVGIVYKNGYYLEVPLDMLATQLVRIIGSRWIKNKDLVLQVILYCANIGLFDKALLNQSVITSVGIQRRYSEVTVRNKVNKDKYWLIGKDNSQSAVIVEPEKRVSVTETPVNVTETEINATSIPQKERKEKESKLNERREEQEQIAFELPATDGIYKVTTKQLQQLQEIYNNIDVINSFRKMQDFLQMKPKSRRPLIAMENRVLLWLNEDNEKATLKKETAKAKKTTQKSSYDISEFEKYDIFE